MMRVSHWKAGSDILCDYVVVDIRNSWIDVEATSLGTNHASAILIIFFQTLICMC